MQKTAKKYIKKIAKKTKKKPKLNNKLQRNEIVIFIRIIRNNKKYMSQIYKIYRVFGKDKQKI